jgi:outer membrane protein assembly factor BamB
MKKNKALFSLVILSFLSVLGIVSSITGKPIIIGMPYVVTWSPPLVLHSVKSTKVRNLWSLPDIYTSQSAFSPMLVADAGKIVLIGGLDKSKWGHSLICLDSIDGHLKWQKTDLPSEDPGYLSSLTAKSGELFVGYGGVPSVKRFNFSSGDLLWSQPIKGRGQSWIFTVDNEVQAPSDPFIFSALDSETGKILRTKKGDDIFISTPEDTFLPWGRAMRATKTNTGELLWEVQLDHELTLAPVFTEKIIYLRTGRDIGSVYAIERSTGQVIWKTDDTFISDIALSEKKDSVYVINQNGEVWEINGPSGDAKLIISFSNTPFRLYGLDAIARGYEIALNNTNDVLYILLGDSRQLFAFQLD